MTAPENLDTLFHQAVSAIDAGDLAALEGLLAENPRLVRDRLESPGAWLRDEVGDALDGFFRRPYLLWFVAEDPMRNGRLPGNIAQVTRAILGAAEREGVDSLQEQLDYALRLVAWSWIARQCGVQSELIDVLIDAGARPGDTITHDALVNGNFAAAGRLVERGARLTLATALCLERWEDVARLAPAASARDRQVALVLAALHGKTDALVRLLALGVDVNAYSTDVYTHATALHHAVSSGSLDAVKVLVEAGAGLGTKDRAWDGTPLGWAEHYVEAKGDDAGRPYFEIAAYLRGKAARSEGGKSRPLEEIEMESKPERDIEKDYPKAEFVAKLRRLADAIENGERFEIRIAGERIYVPVRATFNIEHERAGDEEEIEFQIKWERE